MAPKTTNYGRPKMRLEINFQNPFQNFYEIERLSKLDGMQEVLESFAAAIMELFIDNDNINEDKSDKDSLDDPAEIFNQILQNIPENDHQLMIDPICDFVCKMSKDNQTHVYKQLGESLNRVLYDEVDRISAKTLSLVELQHFDKEEYYASIDSRIVTFIDALTEKKGNKRSQDPQASNTNFKMNAIENLIKARDSKFVSVSGLREHMVTYMSSGRSIHVSQVFSKQGAKGTRPLLENILDNSMTTCTFKVPENKSMSISFDNIQKLYKNYRLGVGENEKAIATVVTSVLCTLPDGQKSSNVQFLPELSPENWLYSYGINQTSKYAVPVIDNNVLKDMLKESFNNGDGITKLFRRKLEYAIKTVKSELDEDGCDSIDYKINQSKAKRRKVCEKGHINNEVRGNQKKCRICHSNFNERTVKNDEPNVEVEDHELNNLKTKDKSILHHPIENFISNEKPLSKSMCVICISDTNNGL